MPVRWNISTGCDFPWFLPLSLWRIISQPCSHLMLFIHTKLQTKHWLNLTEWLHRWEENRINSDGVWKVFGASVRENMYTWRMVMGKGCHGVHGMKASMVVEAELHVFLTLVLDWSWSASRSDRHAPVARAPGTLWIGSWVGHGSGLDVLEKRTCLDCEKIRTRILR